MTIRFNVKEYKDRRGPRELGAARAIEQARADAALEKLWRDRVQRNEAARLARKHAGDAG